MDLKKGCLTAVKVCAAIVVLGTGTGVCLVLVALGVVAVVGGVVELWTHTSDVAKAFATAGAVLGSIYGLFFKGMPWAWNYLRGMCSRKKGSGDGK